MNINIYTEKYEYLFTNVDVKLLKKVYMVSSTFWGSIEARKKSRNFKFLTYEILYSDYVDFQLRPCAVFLFMNIQ